MLIPYSYIFKSFLTISYILFFFFFFFLRCAEIKAHERHYLSYFHEKCDQRILRLACFFEISDRRHRYPLYTCNWGTLHAPGKTDQSENTGCPSVGYSRLLSVPVFIFFICLKIIISKDVDDIPVSYSDYDH